MELKQFEQLLERQGARIIRNDGRLIFINAEATPDLFDFWGEEFFVLGIHPDIQAIAKKHGWYFEWEDACTIIAVPD
jgi:hypothetical protein